MTESKMIPATDAKRVTRKEKSVAKERINNALMFLPNLVKLCGKLLTDNRVSTADKALFAGAIIYAIMPLDLIPDVLPFIGQIDDTYLIALSLLRLVNRTDESVIREHWSGGGDIVGLADTVARLAPALLPKRVTRILSSKVELAGAGKTLSDVFTKHEPIAVEYPQEEPVLEGARN